MADGEFHVASYVVSARPNDAERVAAEIGNIAGLEVHGNGDGKIVVTAEAGDVRRLAELADELAAIDSVINVVPVYHEYAGTGDGEASV